MDSGRALWWEQHGVCAECGGRLEARHTGGGVLALRCALHPEHRGHVLRSAWARREAEAWEARKNLEAALGLARERGPVDEKLEGVDPFEALGF